MNPGEIVADNSATRRLRAGGRAHAGFCYSFASERITLPNSTCRRNAMNTDKTKDSLAKHADHYKSMGAMPEALAQLAEAAPEVFDTYSRMRAALLKSEADGAALPLKYKHLILVVLDAIRDEQIGIINHTRAAMMAGLTKEELAEGILLGIIVYGMPAWGKTGRKAVEFAKGYSEELKRQNKA
jgi:alkylhydroperoxidase/carboxymuconolactone decarboxylase family protein YurZ